MTTTRVIKPTPCPNVLRPPGDGKPILLCPGHVHWEDTRGWRLGTCDECHHDYAGRTPVYDQPEPAPLRAANAKPEMPPPPEEPADHRHLRPVPEPADA